MDRAHGIRVAERPRRADERGAMLILGAVFAAVAVVAAALSVDIGRIAVEKRSLQKIADMAALDAARDPSQAATLAAASAARNGFTMTGSNSTVTVGHTDPTTWAFTAGGTPSDSVKVTVSSTNKYFFASGTKSLTATAIGTVQGRAGFTVGSSLVSVDTTKAALLNPIVGSMLGTALNLGVATWQGLLTGAVTMSALGTQLASLGIAAATPQQLLSSQMTVAQLYTATANALTANGDLVNANVFNTLALQTTNTAKIKLGDLINIAQGSEGTALASSLDLFQLVTASAALANGTNAISIPSLNVNIPGLLSVSLSLSVGQGQFYGWGPVNTKVPALAPTRQVDLKLDASINLGLIKVDLPIHVTAAQAQGTLTAVNCSAPQSIAVRVDTATADVSASAIASVWAVLGWVSLPITLDIPIGTSQTTVGFNYTNEFTAPVGPTTQSKHVGPSGLGLGQALPIVGSVLDQLDSLVIQPLLQALGISVGGADVSAVRMDCSTPSLVK